MDVPPRSLGPPRPRGGALRPRISLPRLVITIVCLVVAIFLAWRVLTTAIDGFARLVGLTGSSVATPTVTFHRVYIVRSGDTVSTIAAKYGLPASLLVTANHLRHPNQITPGQRLIVPYPYHPLLTRRLIASSARRSGLDPAFATAVAYQESGFDENQISPTGAVGIMQLEPGTAELVAHDLSRSFNIGVEADNIAVGEYWLGYLVRYYGGNEWKAAAAYYEGQGNLAAHGYLPGTGRYVADVMALRRFFAHHQTALPQH